MTNYQLMYNIHYKERSKAQIISTNKYSLLTDAF